MYSWNYPLNYKSLYLISRVRFVSLFLSFQMRFVKNTISPLLWPVNIFFYLFYVVVVVSYVFIYLFLSGAKSAEKK
jgi:hypothetical protein